jgi:hypothetical protein
VQVKCDGEEKPVVIATSSIRAPGSAKKGGRVFYALLHQESVRGATFRLTAHLDEVMQT